MVNVNQYFLQSEWMYNKKIMPMWIFPSFVYYLPGSQTVEENS